MERITLRVRTTKKDGEVPLTFRLRDTGGIDLSYKSDIAADVKQLPKLAVDGTAKPRVSTVDLDLVNRIKERKEIISKAYHGMKQHGYDITSDILQREVEKLLFPVVELRTEKSSLLDRFDRYADEAVRDGIMSEARQKHVKVVGSKLRRFLIIEGISEITAEEFTADILMRFRNFIFEEYKYVAKHKRLYKDFKKQNLPSARASSNTVVSQLKMIQTFFTVLEDNDEIPKSPFRRLGTERRRTVMKTQYDEPVFLRADELTKIRNAELPQDLRETRDAFVVQCAFGCRISDFQNLTMDKIAVSEDGIPYIHYIPRKTAKEQVSNTELKTPIVRYAFDIIKRTGFQFKILRNISGANGYNERIRKMLKVCGIDRKVAHYDESKRENVYLPLYEAGSSKLARKTHVDMMAKVQIDKYASGLHKEGSGAVEHYTALEIKDRIALMNLAFDQQPYKTDANLSIISE
jgi:hypothetical protein